MNLVYRLKNENTFLAPDMGSKAKVCSSPAFQLNNT